MAEGTEHFRWLATATYRSENGPIEVDHYFEGVEELHTLIERGPDWNALEIIVVRLNPKRATYPGDTVRGGRAALVAKWPNSFGPKQGLARCLETVVSLPSVPGSLTPRRRSVMRTKALARMWPERRLQRSGHFSSGRPDSSIM